MTIRGRVERTHEQQPGARRHPLGPVSGIEHRRCAVSIQDDHIEPLWFVVRRVTDPEECYRARCYLCAWSSEPADTIALAQAWLGEHIETRIHQQTVGAMK